MAAISISGNNTVEANKLHIYIRPATTAPADYEVSTLGTALTASSYFPAIETGFTIETAEGEVIMATDGKEYLLSTESTGEFNFLFATPTDYDNLYNTSTGYQNKSVDIIAIKAPSERTKNTVVAGDEYFAIYAVNLKIRPSLTDNAPTKLVMSFKKSAGASTQVLAWKTVIADTP